jgi:hypothetical protein
LPDNGAQPTPASGRGWRRTLCINAETLLMLALKAAAVWLLILGCAILNGALREGVLLPKLGLVPAYVLSGLLLSLCILGVSAALVPWFGPVATSGYLMLGAFWLVLTLVFEFGFGHFIQHKTWQQLVEAYTLRDGNIWPLILVVTAFAPLVAARLRGVVQTFAS